MRKIIAIALVLNVFGLSLLLAASPKKRKARPNVQAAALDIPEFKNAEPGDQALAEDQLILPPRLVLKEDERSPLHEIATKVLNNINPTPIRRVQQFAWVNRHEARVSNWLATIEKLTPIPGGAQVILRVHPQIDGGASALITNDHVYEQYNVVKGEVQPVDFAHPQDTSPTIDYID